MKVLLDENISDELKKLFEASGFDILDLKRHPLQQLPDKQILEIATREKRIIITHDKDFLPFMFNPKCKAKILLLSIQPQTEERMIAVGKFLITSGIVLKITKSAIVYYHGEEVSIASV